jgi:2-dehydropantoate 2-reductase
MKIAMIGLGGVGVSLLRSLKEAGLEPICFSNTKIDHFDVRLQGKPERLELDIHTAVSESLMKSFDLLIFCLKNQVLVREFDHYFPLLNDDGLILCAQNGIMEYFLSEKVSDESRILGAQVKGNAIRTPPNRVDIPHPIRIVVGPMRPGGNARTGPVLKLFERTSFSSVVSQILPLKWTKLVFSSAVNPLSALTGFFADRLMRDPTALKVATGIINEVIAAADAEGIVLAKEGPLSPYWFRNSSGLPRFIKFFILRLFSLSLKGMKVSMLQDIEQGRQTEIDTLNGFVIERCRRHGLESPFNELTLKLVKDLEAKSLRSGGENLKYFQELISSVDPRRSPRRG